MTEPELVAIDLEDDERELMVQGLNEYFKSAKSGIPLLVLLFRMSGAEEFQALVWRLLEAVATKNHFLSSTGRALCSSPKSVGPVT